MDDQWYLSLDMEGYLYPSSTYGEIMFRKPNSKLLMPSDDANMPSVFGVVAQLTMV